jgi:hypothetical protein
MTTEPCYEPDKSCPHLDILFIICHIHIFAWSPGGFFRSEFHFKMLYALLPLLLGNCFALAISETKIALRRIQLHEALVVLDPQLGKPILAGNFAPEYHVSLFDAVYETCFAR